MLYQTQNLAPFYPKCWYNVRKMNKLPYVFSVVFCIFLAFSVTWKCWYSVRKMNKDNCHMFLMLCFSLENATKMKNTTLKLYSFSYIISTFGIKRCKILCFMKHFYRSLESSQVRALQNKVNVWDHMSCVASQCLKQFGWCACGIFRNLFSN